MPCDVTATTVSPPIFPPIGGDFGIPISPLQIPFNGVDIPTGLIENLFELVNKVEALFPSSTFKATPSNFAKNIFDYIGSILSQIAPFLSFYNFIMALFNLILCIIEVICAIPNPFKIASAVNKLLSQCLPPFLKLFPWLALIAMIIALILLIIALIEYLVAKILAIIAELIRNLIVLGEAATFNDATATLAGVQKVAELLCLIQNLMAIFVAVSAVIAVIQALALIAGGAVCDDEDAGGCCSPDVCPPFIKDSPLTGTAGRLVYHKQVGVDLSGAFADPSLAALLGSLAKPIRPESWQFYNASTNQSHSFKEIITPIISTSFPISINTFWPEGMVYSNETPPSKAPYTVDLTVTMNPSQFVPTDFRGIRKMVIKDCVVIERPYIGIYNHGNTKVTTNSNNSGTLKLEGGLVYEADGVTPFMVNSSQATLNTFIHQADSLSSTTPSSDDSIVFSDIEFTFKPVYGVLMSHSLITAGCLPEVRLEKKILNTMLIAEDIRAVVDKLPPLNDGARTGTLPNGVRSVGFLPNIAGAQNCVVSSLDNLRLNVTLQTAAVFQASAQACLADLLDQCNQAVTGAVMAAASQFSSQVSLNTNLEFVTRPITTTVKLLDSGGTNIATNLPVSSSTAIAQKIQGEVTLGNVSEFTYDGYGSFNALITSSTAGDGYVSVLFNNKILSTIIPLSNGIPSQIIENTLPYRFVGTPAGTAVRRDATDIASQGKKG